MSYVKNYNPGQIRMDLPTANYIHELPLLSFSDIHGGVNLSLVFNYEMKVAADDSDSNANSNPFNIAPGYKLNLQKRLILENNVPVQFQDESGKCIQLNSSNTIYTFDDDSMRILRRTGSTYMLENADYSKEYYDQLGRITSVYNKYNDLVLEYGYSNGILDSITYRDTKEITINYSNSDTIVITYGTHIVSLAHSSANNTMTVTNPSGTVCVLTSSANMGFDATVTASGETSTSVNRVCVSKSATNALTITQYVGSATVDSTTYAFPSAITNPTEQFGQAEVTNNQDVTSRMQFYDKKLLYSYEIGDENTMFVDDEFAGNVQIHSVLNNDSNIFAAGVQTIRDGEKMSREDTSSVYCWKNTQTLSTGAGLNGLYTLSGWIKLTSDQSASDTIPMEVAESTNTHHLLFSLPKPPVNQWTYFAVGVPYSYATMYAFISKSLGTIETKDFRYTFQTATAFGGSSVAHMATSEDLLIYPSDNSFIYIPLREATFTHGSLSLASNGIVYFEDLLKYKVNQVKNSPGEFYYNKAKNVATYNPATPIMVADAAGNSVELNNCYLGKRQYSSGGMTTMRIYSNNANGLTSDLLNENGATISGQVMDNNMDITCVFDAKTVTTYERNKDLVLSEQVATAVNPIDPTTHTVLYSRSTSYDETNVKITATDEFGNQTQYTLDPTWGNVTAISTWGEDGWETIFADEYDDDMCTLMKRTFGSTAGRYNTLTYAGGNIASRQTNGLAYACTYSNGDLAAIRKNAILIEEHVHTAQDGSTYPNQTDSYYPSQSSALHSTSAVFDKYGRLTSIDGVLTNTYDLLPDGNTLVGVDNGSSLLATATDEVCNETSQFAYNAKSLLSSKTVVQEANPTSEISQESFVYDGFNRMTADTFIYNKTTGKQVSAQIEYLPTASNPANDSRVSKYTYTSPNATAAVTQNTFDVLKRVVSKQHTLGSKVFTRNFTYNKSRVNRHADTSGGTNLGTNNYGYDAMGRIQSDSYSCAYTSGDYRTYEYDEYGQLVRENNQGLAKTYIYEYNDIGNLTAIQAYPFTLSTAPTDTPVTTTFGYTNDRLTSFGGATIGYNAMGCPTSYEGKTATWTKGKLSRLSRGTLIAGMDSYAYTYNGYGQRIARNYTYSLKTSSLESMQLGQLTASSRKYYYDHAGRLIAEDVTKTYYGEGTTTENIVFLYDESGIIGMELTTGGVSSLYYFQRNLQGDVVAIYDTNGALKAKYLYDAWGNCTISSETTSYDVANANPIRYRGYYYDDDTGLYYCNARYYSPKWRRFISPAYAQALSSTSVNGLNMYIYSDNNPVHIPQNYTLANAKIAANAVSIGHSTADTNASCGNGIMKHSCIQWPKFEKVIMSHETIFTLVKNPSVARFWGNISYTLTTQFNSAEGVYSFVDSGVFMDETIKKGIGLNINNWYGMSVYWTSNIGFGFSWQFTPWYTTGWEWSVNEGFSFSWGAILNNETHEVSVNIGNGLVVLGLLAYFFGPQVFALGAFSPDALYNVLRK